MSPTGPIERIIIEAENKPNNLSNLVPGKKRTKRTGENIRFELIPEKESLRDKNLRRSLLNTPNQSLSLTTYQNFRSLQHNTSHPFFTTSYSSQGNQNGLNTTLNLNSPLGFRLPGKNFQLDDPSNYTFYVDSIPSNNLSNYSPVFGTHKKTNTSASVYFKYDTQTASPNAAGQNGISYYEQYLLLSENTFAASLSETNTSFEYDQTAHNRMVTEAINASILRTKKGEEEYSQTISFTLAGF